MHSADLPFPTLSSDYGSASCPSSLSPPPWSQPRVRSLLRLFRLFLECHLLFFFSCSQFAFTFSVLPPPTSLFLPVWKPALTVCSQVSLCIWPHVTNLVSFLLSFWAWKGTGEWGFFTSCSLWGQATIMYPLAGEGSVFYSVHWEFRDGKLAACIWPAGELFQSFERSLKENVLGKKGTDALVCFGSHLSLLLLTPAA